MLTQKEKENRVEAGLCRFAQKMNAEQDDFLFRSNLDEEYREHLAYIAHEIRNPLSALELHVRAVMRRVEIGELEGAKTSLSCMLGSLDVLKGIADGVGEFSKDLKLSAQSSSVIDLVSSVMEMMKPLFESKGVYIEFISDVDYVAEFDLFKTYQVVTNLLKNSLEATERGGEVSLWLEASGDKVIIFVRDTGCGVLSKNVDKIFMPKFTTKKTGSGIGLYESKRIANAQGGDLVLKGTGVEGSLFALILPISS